MTFAEAAAIMLGESSSPVIQSITITENGTYKAPKGVDGYDPVVVNSPYETLYRIEHGMTEKIGTGIIDDDGNEIIIDGLPVSNIDDVNALIGNDMIHGDKDITITFVAGENVAEINFRNIETNNTIQPVMSMTNKKTGQSVTKEGGVFDLLWYFFLGKSEFWTNGSVAEFSNTYVGGSFPYGDTVRISFSDIGIESMSGGTYYVNGDQI